MWKGFWMLDNYNKKIVEGRIDEIYLTWGQLKDYLNNLSEEELKKPVQIYPPHNTPDKAALQPVYVIDKLANLSEDGDTRDFVDNGHHPENYVLLTDHNGFDEDGNEYYTLEDKKMIGNKSGKYYDFFGNCVE